MPNWCQNEVTITGDEEKLKELESLVEEMMKAASDVVEEYKDDEDIERDAQDRSKRRLTRNIQNKSTGNY